MIRYLRYMDICERLEHHEIKFDSLEPQIQIVNFKNNVSVSKVLSNFN